jgi:hypothetical protein
MTMNTMSVEAGWTVTEAIAEIIDDEMAQSADHTWDFDGVVQKVVERRIVPGGIDVHQAIIDAMWCEPVGTNMGADGTHPLDLDEDVLLAASKKDEDEDTTGLQDPDWIPF